MKKIICLFLSAIFVFCMASFEPPKAFAGFSRDGIEFSMDFNDCNTEQKLQQEFTSRSNRWMFPQEVDKEHGISLAMKSTATVSASMNFQTPIRNGVYSLSFDIRQTSNTSNIAQVRLYEGSTIYRSFLTSNAGGMGLSRFTNGSTMDYKISYSANKWYNVNMWIDFYDRTIYYYIDNEFIGKTHLDRNMNALTAVVFFLSSTDANEFTYWDNIAFRCVDEEFLEEMKSKKVKIPEKIESPVRCGITSERIGNIFEDVTEVELNLDFVGRRENKAPQKVIYEVYGSDGEKVWSAEDTVEAGLSQSVKKILKPDVLRYDIYTLNVKVEENGKSYVFDKEFSVANTPSREMTDKRFGFSCGHQMLFRSTPEAIMPLFDMSGAGLMREGVYWAEYETKKGVYGFSQKIKTRIDEVLEYAEKYDLYITFNVSASNSLYPNPAGKASTVPLTETGLAALEEFAYNLAKEYKQIDAFLFVNEPDANSQFKLTCEEYATALKYFYNGIKRGNAETKVWGCNTMRADTMWVEGVIQAGGGEYMDGVTIHPYQGQHSAESTMWVDYVMTTRKMLDSYGYENLTLVASEANGSSSFDYFTELQHGFNLIRQFSLMEAYDFLDGYIGYTFATFDDATDNESCFGIVRGWNVDTSYGAKPAYMAVCNFFAQKENTVFNKLLKEDNIYVYHFKNENGKDMLMMYADREAETVSLKIDAEKGILSDMYGNGKEIYGMDGTYTFILDDCPQYFSGDFADVEFTDGKIKIDGLRNELTKGSKANVDISVENSANYTYEIEGNDSLKATVKKSYNGVSAEIEALYVPEKFDFMARRHDYGTLDNRDYAVLDVKKDGKIYATLPLAINYVDKPVDVTMSIKPYDFDSMEHQIGVINVKNNNSHDSISGEIKITAPKALADYTEPIMAENVSPLSEKQYTIRIPSTVSDSTVRITGKMKLDSGEEITFYATGHPRSYYTTPGSVTTSPLLRMTKAPKIDGKVEDGEWEGRELTTFDKSEVTFGADVHIVEAGVQTHQTFGEDADYGAGNDFSGTLYAQWDDEFLYLAAKVRDDVHVNNENSIKFRTVDSAYFTAKPNMAARHDSAILMGLTDFYGEPQSMMFNTWTNIPDKPYSYTFHVDGVDTSEFEIIRDAEYTTYEAKVPWEYLMPDPVGLNDNFYFSFSVRDFDGDRDKSYGYSRWVILASDEFGSQ